MKNLTTSTRVVRLAELAPSWLALMIRALALCATVAGVCQAEAPELSPREPLIDAVARDEVDGYARLDQAMTRASALPDVFDPGVYASGATTTEVRGRILGYLLWLRGAESSHLERIESLPTRLDKIVTREPYRKELIDLYRASTPERRRRIETFYEGEIAAAERRVAFLDFLDRHGIRAEPAGFVFSGDAEIEEYRDMVTNMNDISVAQDRRVGAYYAWEIRQKALLRQFRDRL